MEEQKLETKKKGKTFLGLPIIAVVIGLLVIGGASAALMTYFGRINATVNVEQSVTLDGQAWDDEPLVDIIPESAPGGETFCYLHKVRNFASVDIPVDFTMTCTKDDELDACEGITQEIYTVPEETVLYLVSKGSDWKDDGVRDATLTFKTASPKFTYKLSATGLEANTDYAMIYYYDVDPRFSQWGAAAGEIIAEFTSDGSGAYDSGLDFISVELGTDLPKATDWNADRLSSNYCESDGYEHCNGAKIWIVPTSVLTGEVTLPLVKWEQSEFLFETDLIVYSYCDNDGGLGFDVNMVKSTNPVVELLTLSKQMTPILTCYEFDVMIEPGTYNLETTMNYYAPPPQQV